MATATLSLNKLIDYTEGSSFVVNDLSSGSKKTFVAVFNITEHITVTKWTPKISSVTVGGQNWLSTEIVKITYQLGTYTTSGKFWASNAVFSNSDTVSEKDGTTSSSATISHPDGGGQKYSKNTVLPAIQITVESTQSLVGCKVVMSGFSLEVNYESGHDYTSQVTKAATCTSAGETTYTCDCGDSYVDKTIPEALGHSFGSTTAAKAATCIATGNSAYKKCSRCNLYFAGSAATNATGGKSDTSSFVTAKDPNNHTGGTEIRNATSATCTSTGYTGDTYCKGCGVKISSGSTIAKKSHTEVTIPAVAATCTATGLTEGKKCSVCGTVTVAQTTVAKNPNNHSGSQTTIPAVAATCTATGLTEGKKWSCCNAIITAQQTVAKLGHSYTSKVTAPTATAGGYTTYTCSRCGHSYKDNYTFLITANSNNNNYGTVSGGGTYNQGATATLTATAKPCYKFVKWNDGNTSATRTVTVSASATYTATFEADPPKILSVTITRSSDLAKVTMSTPVDAGAKYIISVEVT